MVYLFSKLSKIAESTGAKFTVAPKLTEIQTGDKVLTGGKIVSIIPDIGEHGETLGYIMTLDDDLDFADVYLIPKVYDAYKDSLAVGAVLLVQGRSASVQLPGHPGNKVRRYIMATALREVSSEIEE